MSDLTYTPDSQVLIDFHNADALVRAVCGPPGSGKSVAMAMEILFLAMRQAPDNDNFRRIKAGVIRKTFRRLNATTRKTLVAWLPEGAGTIKQTPPMSGDVQFPHPSGDGTTCHIHYDLMSFDKPEDLQNLDSYEASVIFINEANEVEESVLVKAIERIGRFPSAHKGSVCTEPCVLVDFNPQGEDHWVHKTFVAGKLNVDRMESLKLEGMDDRPMMEYFQQPAPVMCSNFEDADAGMAEPQFELNPDADNLKNLPPNYYLNQLSISMQSGAWDLICSRLLMVWRTPVVGKRVHPDFSKTTHVSREPLDIIPNEDVLVGFDTSGIHPACVIGQHHNGTLYIYMALYGKEKGLDEFVELYLQPILASKFPGCKVLAICDPANARNSKTATTPTHDLNHQFGIPAIEAPSNQFNKRKRDVAKLLRVTGACIIDGTTTDTDYIVTNMLIEGLARTYVHKIMRGVFDDKGKPVYENAPANKHDNSHCIDAFQYLSGYLINTSMGDVADEEAEFIRKLVGTRTMKRKSII